MLPREFVDAPFLEEVKTILEKALGNLIWWIAFLPMAGRRELDNL